MSLDKHQAISSLEAIGVALVTQEERKALLTFQPPYLQDVALSGQMRHFMDQTSTTDFCSQST